MPYGGKTETINDKQTINCTSQAGVPYSTLYPAITYTKSLWNRSGTNFSGRLSAAASYRTLKVPYLAVVTVYNGPRLPYKIKLKNGKTVWARKPMQIHRIKYRSIRKQARKGLDLPPNALDFYKNRLDMDPGCPTSWAGKNLIYPKQTYSVSGQLLANYDGKPYGSVSKKVTNGIQDYSGIAWASESDIQRASDMALKALYSRLADQKVNLAQVLGERRQTAALISDVVTRIARAVKDVKKGNVIGALSNTLPKGTRGIANDFLAYQFGVRPLLSDVKGAAEALAALTVDSPRFLDVVAARTVDVPESTFSKVDNHWTYTVTTAKTKRKVTVKYKLRFELEQKFSRNAASLGFTNLPALAWELLPWTFVIDWFLPIGDKIGSLDVFSGLRYVHGHKTVVIEEDVKLSRSYGARTSASNISGPYAVISGTIKKVRVTRTVLSTPPDYPSLSFRDPISMNHLADCVALLRQLLKEK